MASCAPVVYRRSERIDNPRQAASLPHIGLSILSMWKAMAPAKT